VPVVELVALALTGNHSEHSMLVAVGVVATILAWAERVEMVAAALAAVVQLVLTAQQIVVVAVVELVLLLEIFRVAVAHQVS
jgi:hypothetical protein